MDMTGIIMILTETKGKILDAAKFDLLKGNYELQNQTICQLKEHNEALQARNESLNSEVADQKMKIKTLEEQLSELRNNAKTLEREASQQNLSEVANNILALYLELDQTELYAEQIIRDISHSRIAVESAIDELCDEGYIESSYGNIEMGIKYLLTPKGKKAILDQG